MPKVRLVPMGEMRKMFDYQMMDMNFEGTTVGELLRAIRISEGISLYDLLVERGWLGTRCHLYINERYVGTPQGLEKLLNEGDRVIVTDRMRAYFAG